LAELDAWVVATAPAAVAYAASLLRDRGAAEDLVQDCYCRLLQRAGVYDLPRDGRKLLFQSITNACINHNTRSRMILSLDGTRGDTAGEGGLHAVLADPRADEPARALLQRELADAVADGLAELPLTQRAALEMKSLGHSLQEIAEALDVTANHAGVLIHRARQALAQRLAPYLEEKTG
jgi:RNA polymerase sigma-70 factor (ECF subfamily)